MLIDDLKATILPEPAEYLISQVRNLQYQPRQFSLVKNAGIFSLEKISLKEFEKVNEKPDAIVFVFTGENFPTYDFLKMMSRPDLLCDVPLVAITNYKYADLIKYANSISMINNESDVIVFLSVLSNSAESSSLKGYSLRELISEFENAELPLSCWTSGNQLSIINHSLRTYGLDNSTREDSWLMYNWKKYIYKSMNLGMNNYWHYSLVRLWTIVMFKAMLKKDESWKMIDYENVWKLYYTPEVLYSPNAREYWVQPDIREL